MGRSELKIILNKNIFKEGKNSIEVINKSHKTIWNARTKAHKVKWVGKEKKGTPKLESIQGPINTDTDGTVTGSGFGIVELGGNTEMPQL